MMNPTMRDFSDPSRETAKPSAPLKPRSLDDLAESHLSRVARLWLMTLITIAVVIGGIYVLIGMFGMAVDFINYNEAGSRPSEWRR